MANTTKNTDEISFTYDETNPEKDLQIADVDIKIDENVSTSPIYKLKY